MATSNARRNRRRLKAKLINLARDFELQQNCCNEYSSTINKAVSVDCSNCFKLFQGKAQRTKLAKNSKWLWFNQYYSNRKAFNRSIGYSVNGMPLKNPNKIIIQKQNKDNNKVVVLDNDTKLFNLYKAYEYNFKLGNQGATENYYNMIIKLQTKLGFDNPTRLDFISIDLRK